MLLACASSLILGHSFYYYFDIVYGGPRLALRPWGRSPLLLARSLLRLFDILVGYARRLSDPVGVSIVARWIAGGDPFCSRYSIFYRHLLPEFRRQGQWYHGQSTFLSGRLKPSALAKRGIGSSYRVPVGYSARSFSTTILMPWEGGRAFGPGDIPGVSQKQSPPRAAQTGNFGVY